MALEEVAERQLVKRRRFTVEEYRKMGETGIFSEDDRVELIDGEVVTMSPIGWRHAWCVRQLIRILASFARYVSETRYEVDAHNPITLDDSGEPQPDLLLLRDPPTGRLPGPGEVVLAVEVADTSLAYDRNIKLPRYAAAGILETWLVDLNANRIEVHSEPGPNGYRKTTRCASGNRAESATLPGLAFDAGESLPPKTPNPEQQKGPKLFAPAPKLTANS